MKKIVIFDGGFGGELFADYFEQELPVVEVIRVIDWRHANQILKSVKDARKAALEALRPYLGTVDLIIFANHLLTLTSLDYFRRKFKNQKFSGLPIIKPVNSDKTLILTTKAVRETLADYTFRHHLNGTVKEIVLDSWPNLIDDGELTEDQMRKDLASVLDFHPDTIVLENTTFVDIRKELHRIIGHNLTINTGYQEAFDLARRELKFKGATRKKI